MKRSEAIEKLILWSKSNEEVFLKPLDQQWDHLLTFLENDLGMLPPIIFEGNWADTRDYYWEPESRVNIGPGHFVVSDEEFNKIIENIQNNEISEQVKKST